MPELSEQELSPASIRDGLATHFVGHHILYYPSVSSTMDAAREAASKGAQEGTVVVADDQTAGRGRLQRTWLAPPGSSLLLSVVLRPTLSQVPRLTMMASLAVARALEQHLGLVPSIKWPNDVLLGGKKVCGIIVESETRGDAVTFAIVGIGLNVNFDPSFLEAEDLVYPATTLSAELGHLVPRVSLLQRLLYEIERLYVAIGRRVLLHEEWRLRLDTLGKQVRVTAGAQIEEGLAESVDADGNLLLRRRDGQLITIVAGDVTLRG